MHSPVGSGSFIDTHGNRYECSTEMNCEITATGQVAVGSVNKMEGILGLTEWGEDLGCDSISELSSRPKKKGKIVPVLNSLSSMS
jgi:hypothetical protein